LCSAPQVAPLVTLIKHIGEIATLWTLIATSVA
jgi:hypothetical protein